MTSLLHPAILTGQVKESSRIKTKKGLGPRAGGAQPSINLRSKSNQVKCTEDLFCFFAKIFRGMDNKLAIKETLAIDSKKALSDIFK